MEELPKAMADKLLRLAVAMGDPKRVGDRLAWGADPNTRSKKGTPVIVRATRGDLIQSEVVRVLLDAGADPEAPDASGLRALDHAKRRLQKYEGRARKPARRSPSLTPQGDVRLSPGENRFLQELRDRHPRLGAEFELSYLDERRQVAERTFDVRGELEKIVGMLESRKVAPSRDQPI